MLSQSGAAKVTLAPTDAQSRCETEYKDSAPKESGLASVSGEAFGPACEEFEPRVVVKFSAGKEFMRKLRRFRALAWHRLPANATMEQVIGLLLDDSLKRTDPDQREARRARRQERVATGSDVPGAPATQGAARERELAEPQVARGKATARRIPARVRDSVFVRVQGKCTFVGEMGHRCGSVDALQVDHVVPVALGGSAAPDNLRLLCGYHNRLEAERVFGKFR